MKDASIEKKAPRLDKYFCLKSNTLWSTSTVLIYSIPFHSIQRERQRKGICLFSRHHVLDIFRDIAGWHEIVVLYQDIENVGGHVCGQAGS